MMRLSSRIDRLEQRNASPAAVREAAEHFQAMMTHYIDQFTEADAAARSDDWSKARQTGWLIRFKGHNLAEALAVLGVTMPGDLIETVLIDGDGLDRLL